MKISYSIEAFPKPHSLYGIQGKVTRQNGASEASTFLLSYRIPAQHKYKAECELSRLGVHEGLHEQSKIKINFHELDNIQFDDQVSTT